MAKKEIFGLVLFLIIIIITYLFDNGLSVGLCLLTVLSCITVFVINKLGFKDRKIYLLFLIALITHLFVALFMHYSSFQPFSGGHGDGDYLVYQKSAVEFSQEFRQGNFSFKDIKLKHPDLYIGHYYPAVVGAIYALTLPQKIIGLMLNVWLVAFSIILVCFIILEIGGLLKNAFIIGLITSVYPSYIFNTGLLLKDAIEIFFIILGLLFLIKTIKKFTWCNFSVLYLATFCATHFRFYMGYALISTFLLSWFVFANIKLKKRLLYGIIFIIILGFIPQVAADRGYYGINLLKAFINHKTISYYRQTLYNPTYVRYKVTTLVSGSNTTAVPNTTAAPQVSYIKTTGLDSSFVAEDNPIGYIKSFIYVLLGPFPWQIKYLRQSLALIETIPWYLLLFFVADGIIILFKKRVKEAAPLLFFSTIVIVVIAIFDTNYGLILRIRIPAFISLLCLASFGFNKSNIVYSYLNKIYAKMFSYWRGWIYRQPSC